MLRVCGDELKITDALREFTARARRAPTPARSTCCDPRAPRERAPRLASRGVSVNTGLTFFFSKAANARVSASVALLVGELSHLLERVLLRVVVVRRRETRVPGAELGVERRHQALDLDGEGGVAVPRPGSSGIVKNFPKGRADVPAL